MDTYDDLFQKASANHWLRSSIGTTSCKLSALHYILIDLMMGKVEPSRIPILIKKIVQNPELKPILSNQSVDGIKIKDTSFLKGHLWYVGLVKKSQDLSFPGNVIDHYFVIVKKEDGFKIISSYGCSLVYMKQYETPLDLSEFDTFIKALKLKTRAAKHCIRDFMKKYFLHLDHYVEKEVEPDENEGRTKTSPTLRDAEVEGYVTSKYHLEYYPIIDTLQTIIDREVSGGMRKNRTLKGKHRQYVHCNHRRHLTFHKKSILE
jgi:hypothetical protein